ncbi:MAG TPA: hypothetical protein VLC79_15010, partial [Cellvibrio sp.]|nr:hypothetical protein [Cellvibrio sp.]
MSKSVPQSLQRAGFMFLLFCCGAGFVWAGTTAAGTPATGFPEEGAAANKMASRSVIIRQSNMTDINNEDFYFYHLLQLVLRKTDVEGNHTTISQLPYRLEDKRLRTEMMNGVVDILWSPTSREFEQQMLPIRV